MNGKGLSSCVAIGLVLLAACQSPMVDDGSLATMKRIQEKRLMAVCMAEHSVGISPRTTSLEWGYRKMDLLHACHDAADARVW